MIKDWLKKYGLTVLFAWGLLAAVILVSWPKTANALFSCPCGCSGCGLTVRQNVISSVINTGLHEYWRDEVFGNANPVPDGEGLMGLHQEWLRDVFFGEHIAPAMRLMTEQLVTVSMHHMFVIGTLFDAKTALETQRLYQELMAEAHHDYHPSTGMCTFGTNVRSLAASDFNGTYVQRALSRRYLDRQMGIGGANAAEGPSADMSSQSVQGDYGRLGLFKSFFCDRKDWNRLLFTSGGTVLYDSLGNPRERDDTGLYFCEMIPDPDNPPEQVQRAVFEGTVNSDIDFTRTIMLPRVIDFDLSYPDGTPLFASADVTYSDTTVNRTVTEMSNNLYGHEVFSRPFRDSNITDSKYFDDYLDVRAVTAKRSVAQNTFNALVALKARGTDENSPASGNAQDTAQYMNVILRALGISDDEIRPYLLGVVSQRTLNEEADGREAAPVPSSYYAQMELLAKRIYQMPAFYTDLYDTPANVQRKGVAMQAIGLMLDRDIYDSYLRSEMLLSQLLEIRLHKMQQEIEDDIALLEEAGG